jgi:hypothetical protein
MSVAGLKPGTEASRTYESDPILNAYRKLSE